MTEFVVIGQDCSESIHMIFEASMIPNHLHQIPSVQMELAVFAEIGIDSVWNRIGPCARSVRRARKCESYRIEIVRDESDGVEILGANHLILCRYVFNGNATGIMDCNVAAGNHATWFVLSEQRNGNLSIESVVVDSKFPIGSGNVSRNSYWFVAGPVRIQVVNGSIALPKRIRREQYCVPCFGWN